jgi:uncharacterized protein YbjT (DUF2867 family)
MKILITGAAGNLGSLLARHLIAHRAGHLRLMVFRRDVPADLKVEGSTETVRADLSRRESLTAAVKGVDVIVHFAGVLFKANPESFLAQPIPDILKISLTSRGRTVFEGSF